MQSPRVAVAVSGGRDSMALLHATVGAMQPLGGEVLALHVHHGLHPQADAWLQHVAAHAATWGARFDHRRLRGVPAAGESIEAWARKGRYIALTEMALQAGCDLVLLAHHRQDQAETWMLQALRGGSMVALAAMPRSVKRSGVVWLRPWLHQPRSVIESYVRAHGLQVIDDPSNADTRFARNRIRHEIWPALTKAFPDAETVLVQAAQRAHEAATLAAEVLDADLPGCVQGHDLLVDAWQSLPPARRRNVLQGWLGARLGQGAPRSLVDRLLVEIPRCTSGGWPTACGNLQLHRGVLRMLAFGLEGEVGSAQVPGELRLDLCAPGIYELPAWGGAFLVSALPSQPGSRGIATNLLREVRIGGRSGGERFRLAPRAAARSLKKQFQAKSVPPWMRAGPYLFSIDDRLLYVPGLGVDASIECGASDGVLYVEWMPAAGGQRRAAPATG